MASAYSAYKIELMATGEDDGTWGDITNQNFLAFQQMITGAAPIPFASADVTLPFTDTNAFQSARAFRLIASGTTGGVTRNLNVPNLPKQYSFYNASDGPIKVKTAAGTIGVTVPVGRSAVVFVDGADGVVEVFNYTSSLLSPSISNNGRGILLQSDNASFADVVFDLANGVFLRNNWADASYNWYFNNVSKLAIDGNGSVASLGAIAGAVVYAGPSSDIGFSAVSNNYSQFRFNRLGGAVDPLLHYDVNANSLSWYSSGVQRFIIDNSSNVWIGGALTVAGAMTGTTGAFASGVQSPNVSNNSRGMYLNSDNASYSQIYFDQANNYRFINDWNTGVLTWVAGGGTTFALYPNSSMAINGNIYQSGGSFVYQSAFGNSGANTRLISVLQDQDTFNYYAYDHTGAFTGTVCAINIPNKRWVMYGGCTVAVSSGIGGNIQYKIDGVTRWEHNVAGNGDFSVLNLNASAGLASEMVRYGLADFKITYGNNCESLFLKSTSGSWFSGTVPIHMTGQNPCVLFQASGGVTAAFGQADGASAFYMARGDGTAGSISFNVATGVGQASQWAVTSDERLKFDIQALPSGLDALTALQPFTYMQAVSIEEAAEGIGIPSAGIMAQALLGGPFDGLINRPQPVFDSPGFYSFNYTALTAWYIAAFKEVKSRLEATEATLASVLARLDALEAK